MRTLILEAECPACGDNWYSDALNEECEHYCPECGQSMVLTGNKYWLLSESEQYKLKQYEYRATRQLTRQQ